MLISRSSSAVASAIPPSGNAVGVPTTNTGVGLAALVVTGCETLGTPLEKGTQDKMLAVTSIDRRRVTHMLLDPAALRVHRIEVSIFFNNRSPLPIQRLLHSSYAPTQSQTDTSMPHGKTRRRPLLARPPRGRGGLSPCRRPRPSESHPQSPSLPEGTQLEPPANVNSEGHA